MARADPITGSSPTLAALRDAFAPRAAALRGLRNRLVQLVLVALIPTVGLAVYLRHQLTATVEDGARAILVPVAQNHQATIEGAITRKITLLQSHARSALLPCRAVRPPGRRSQPARAPVP